MHCTELDHVIVSGVTEPPLSLCISCTSQRGLDAPVISGSGGGQPSTDVAPIGPVGVVKMGVVEDRCEVA